MMLFRILLVIIFASLVLYTFRVVTTEGWNLLPIFFSDIAKMKWPGQFNYDFMLMLVLSALWSMWRNKFSAGGIALGLLALVGGSLFLSTYLFALTCKHNGDMKKILCGQHA